MSEARGERASGQTCKATQPGCPDTPCQLPQGHHGSHEHIDARGTKGTWYNRGDDLHGIEAPGCGHTPVACRCIVYRAKQSGAEAERARIVARIDNRIARYVAIEREEYAAVLRDLRNELTLTAPQGEPSDNEDA